MVYFMVWWTALFAILPIGVRPDPEAQGVTGGWRGTPQAPGLLRKALWTTVVTTIIWLGIYALVNSDWLSFRQGWLAMPND
jgi:predicted secreted protein